VPRRYILSVDFGEHIRPELMPKVSRTATDVVRHAILQPPPMEDPFVRHSLRTVWRTLTREQRLSVGVLIVCGVVALTFSIVRVRSAIIRPFTTPVEELVTLRNMLGPSERELLEKQKKTDTDGDGISDYDESAVYRTSPYLRDSDSDGVTDNMEVAQGTDPNCPQGKVCASAVSGTEAPTGTEPNLNFAGAGGAYGDLVGTPGELPSAVPPRDPSIIRQYLKASGMSDAELRGYSDVALLEAYDQSKDEYATTPETASSTAP
jgi:hypothetical protein